MYDMNISENFGSSWSTRTIATLWSRMMTHSVTATAVAKRRGWPVRQPSPRKSPFPVEGNDGLFPLLGYDIDLHLALLDIEDGIRPLSLGEDFPVLAIARYGPSPIHGAEESIHAEGIFLLLSHDLLPFPVPIRVDHVILAAREFHDVWDDA